MFALFLMSIIKSMMMICKLKSYVRGNLCRFKYCYTKSFPFRAYFPTTPLRCVELNKYTLKKHTKLPFKFLFSPHFFPSCRFLLKVMKITIWRRWTERVGKHTFGVIKGKMSVENLRCKLNKKFNLYVSCDKWCWRKIKRN